MAYYTVRHDTNQLLEISDFSMEPPEFSSCMEVAGITKAELEANYIWDSVEATFCNKPSNRFITKLDYMNRFTDAELATIYTIAKTNVAVEIWLEKFKLAAEINLDDPRTAGGVHALEAFGLIGVGRALEILA